MKKNEAAKAEMSESYVRLLVSANLKRLRAMRNLSQISLARAAGLTHNFINDIENGKKGVSARTLAKLSVVLEVEPHQFFLPEDMLGGNMQVYVSDFNDSLQKVVEELTKHYVKG